MSDNVKFLFLNICSKAAYAGHKKFDLEWCDNLSRFGHVDLVQPELGWYEHKLRNVDILTFDSKLSRFWSKFLDLRIFHIGILKSASIKDFFKNKKIIYYVKKLNKKNNYKLIVAAHFDIVTLSFSTINKKLLGKIFVIEHFPPFLSNRILNFFYNFKKNRINHISMEKPAVDALQKLVGIEDNRIFYVPHPYNDAIINVERKRLYDVVGISNSNHEPYIREIIEYEKRTNFFNNNGIKVLLRSKEYEFNNNYLIVVKGYLGFSDYEYNSLIANAKLILVLLPVSFGLRSSGTIIDALSYRVQSIGSPFETYLSYCFDYPSVCRPFSDIDDLIIKIKTCINLEGKDCDKDFDLFYSDRTGETINSFYKNMIFSIDTKLKKHDFFSE